MIELEFAPTVFDQLTYDEAWLYCITLDYDGHKDWRLPSYQEWCNSSKLIGWYKNVKDVKSMRRAACPVRENK